MAVKENMIFVKNDDKSPEEASLMHLEWAVVSQLDGKKTVNQIAENLALNTKEVEQIFEKLTAENLIILVDQSGKDNRVPFEFFKKLGHEMTLLLGPVAGLILDDVFELLSTNKDKIKKNQLPILLDLLANQITDPVKQIEFQKKTYPILKAYLS
jgi:hypothetical protein